MRRITYKRTEFHGDPEVVENDLIAFVYDIPHIGACGIFPPLHIINQIFSNCSGDGGMSPGAIWSPFKITKEEYEELAEAVSCTPAEGLKKKARYSDIQFEFDSEFDHIPEHLQWLEAVCNKHRENYHHKK